MLLVRSCFFQSVMESCRDELRPGLKIKGPFFPTCLTFVVFAYHVCRHFCDSILLLSKCLQLLCWANHICQFLQPTPVCDGETVESKYPQSPWHQDGRKHWLCWLFQYELLSDDHGSYFHFSILQPFVGLF